MRNYNFNLSGKHASGPSAQCSESRQVGVGLGHKEVSLNVYICSSGKETSLWSNQLGPLKLGSVLTAQQHSASPGRNASGHVYEELLWARLCGCILWDRLMRMYPLGTSMRMYPLGSSMRIYPGSFNRGAKTPKCWCHHPISWGSELDKKEKVN